MAGIKESHSREFADGAAELIREYLDAHGFPALRQDRHRGGIRTWHVCPCCGSGSGNNGNFTPAFNVYRGKRGGLRWGCFACPEGQKGGDIFDLAEYVEGARTWPEKVAAVTAFIGEEPAHSARKSIENFPRSKNARQTTSESRHDLQKRRARNAAYTRECMAHVHETDYFRSRGFNDETIDQFHLGYDPKEHAAVIPFVDVRYHTVETYTKRNTLVGAGERGDTWKHRSAPGCRKIIFNMAALAVPERRPVFVTEAPMDAMSVVQSGGSAVALGGTCSSNLLEVLDRFQNHFYDLHDAVFVLALDSDAAGDAGAKNLAAELDKRGIAWLKAEHPCFRNYHDPNEALMNDPDLLAEAVRHEEGRAGEMARSHEASRRLDREINSSHATAENRLASAANAPSFHMRSKSIVNICRSQ